MTAGEYGGLAEGNIPKIKADFERSGFAHAGYKPEIVNEDNYGRTFVHAKWLYNKLSNYQHLKLVAYINRGYARRQDVIGCYKV